MERKGTMRRLIVLVLLCSVMSGCESIPPASSSTAVVPRLHIKFSGAQLLAEEGLPTPPQDDRATAVWALTADLESASHPHYSQLRFGCDNAAQYCTQVIDLRDVEVRLVPEATEAVKIDPTYLELIAFDQNLDYGLPEGDWMGPIASSLVAPLSARIKLVGGELKGAGGNCPYGFARKDETPTTTTDLYTLVHYSREIPTGFKIELWDFQTQRMVRSIPIDPTETWLYHDQGDVSSQQVYVWIVNDPPLYDPASDLHHYLDLGAKLNEGDAVELVPYVKEDDCAVEPPAAGSSFCPPSTYP